MQRWYELTPAERSDEQTREAQEAHYKTLLSTRQGKEVVCDMQRRIAEFRIDVHGNHNLAMALVWLEEFMIDTLAMCGVPDPYKILEAKQRTARSKPHEKTEPFVPEDHSE
jgi:hypothetical protein